MPQLISFDTETVKIIPGNLFPELVCVSTAQRLNSQIVSKLYAADEGADLVANWLQEDDVILIGHNLPFDLGVIVRRRPAMLPWVFRKYEKTLVRDTLIQQQMMDIASGEMKYHVDEDGEPKKTSYTLAALSYRLLKKFLKKEDTWRLRYGELKNIPIDQWPDDARKYAIDDAITTLEVFEKQQEIAFG